MRTILYTAETTMVVDAFQYGSISGCSVYFLSHFHSDHYQGLNRHFRHTVFCSQVDTTFLPCFQNGQFTFPTQTCTSRWLQIWSSNAWSSLWSMFMPFLWTSLLRFRGWKSLCWMLISELREMAVDCTFFLHYSSPSLPPSLPFSLPPFLPLSLLH